MLYQVFYKNSAGGRGMTFIRVASTVPEFQIHDLLVDVLQETMEDDAVEVLEYSATEGGD